MVRDELKRRRLERGVKAKDLAAQLHVSPTFVSLVENQHRHVPPSLFAQWVEAVEPDRAQRARLFVRYIREQWPTVSLDRVIEAYQAKQKDDRALANRATTLMPHLMKLLALDTAASPATERLFESLTTDLRFRQVVLRLAQLDGAKRDRIIAALEMLVPLPPVDPSAGGEPDGSPR